MRFMRRVFQLLTLPAKRPADARWDRRDVEAGRCTGLQVNTETLDEHQRRLRRSGWKPLSRDEALRMFDGEQVEEHFG